MYTTSSASTNMTIMYNMSPATTGAAYGRPAHWPLPDPAQVEATRIRNAELAARRLERIATRERAGDRARATLLSLLNAEQRAQYERDGQFVVQGSDGGRYRIRRGVAQNIEDLSVPYRGTILCAHPGMRVEGGDLPTEDAMIAQLLMLRFDEPAFLAVANRS